MGTNKLKHPLIFCYPCFRYNTDGSPRRVSKSSLDSTNIQTLQTQALENAVSVTSDRHVAKSYEDTSQGAVHCFQDRYGEYHLGVESDIEVYFYFSQTYYVIYHILLNSL